MVLTGSDVIRFAWLAGAFLEASLRSPPTDPPPIVTAIDAVPGRILSTGVAVTPVTTGPEIGWFSVAARKPCSSRSNCEPSAHSSPRIASNSLSWLSGGVNTAEHTKLQWWSWMKSWGSKSLLLWVMMLSGMKIRENINKYILILILLLTTIVRY